MEHLSIPNLRLSHIILLSWIGETQSTQSYRIYDRIQQLPPKTRQDSGLDIGKKELQYIIRQLIKAELVERQTVNDKPVHELAITQAGLRFLQQMISFGVHKPSKLSPTIISPDTSAWSKEKIAEIQPLLEKTVQDNMTDLLKCEAHERETKMRNYAIEILDLFQDHIP